MREGKLVEDILRWTAAGLAMVAAFFVSSRGGDVRTGIGVTLFGISSCLWVVVGFWAEEYNLVAQNAVLAVVNAWGFYRYLWQPLRGWWRCRRNPPPHDAEGERSAPPSSS